MEPKNILYCNCLNVTIESETSEYRKITLDSLYLSEEEQRDPFFKQEHRQVEKLVRISKEHASLVDSRVVGSWIIHNCLNCGLYTHAVHKEHGANCVLVTTALLNSPTIEELQNSQHFSNAFNIVVFREQKDPPIYNSEALSADVEAAVDNLKRIASDNINRETAAVEERIKAFIEQQNTALEVFRERTRVEQALLSRLIINSKAKPKTAMQFTPVADSMPVQLPKYKKEKFQNSPTSSISSTNSPSVIATKKLKSSPRQSTLRQLSTPMTLESNDSEGLFQLEGIDDIKSQYIPEHCDSSDNEDLIKEERYKSHSTTSLAKSLPISIPSFMTTNYGRFSEEDKDDISHADGENPSDIAASIKALAKSVHGDAVFGDLPRPRICNQF